ncbi:MAG: hypothetical protein Q9201_006815 [Fulgogasparrea decipioides]
MPLACWPFYSHNPCFGTWILSAVFLIIAFHARGIEALNATDITTVGYDEFNGFDLRYNKEGTWVNQYTIESLALAAIAAMKEQAEEFYYGTLRQFDFIDLLHPENPVRIKMHAREGAPVDKAQRRSVLWTLRTLTVGLMRSRYFHRLPFVTTYRDSILYLGFIEAVDRRRMRQSPHSSSNGSMLSARASVSSPSLAVVPKSSTTVELRRLSPLKDDPHYEVEFKLARALLSQTDVFDVIMELLLVLGKLDSGDRCPSIRIVLPWLPVSIFLEQVPTPVKGYALQQYQAVTTLEAVARYYVLTGIYRELTFYLKVNGQQLAIGCVLRSTQHRQQCQGLGLQIAPSD